LYSLGRSRHECTWFAQCAQNSVSDVGRTHSRSWSSSSPPRVTHATSGAKPSTWSFSFWSRPSGMSIGRYTFSCPVALNMPSMMRWMFSQMA